MFRDTYQYALGVIATQQKHCNGMLDRELTTYSVLCHELSGIKRHLTDLTLRLTPLGKTLDTSESVNYQTLTSILDEFKREIVDSLPVDPVKTAVQNVVLTIYEKIPKEYKN